MLPTVVSNKTLLLCVIRVLKENTSFLNIALSGSKPLLIKFSDILALCSMDSNCVLVIQGRASSLIQSNQGGNGAQQQCFVHAIYN